MGAAAIFLLVVIAVILFLAFGGLAAIRSWLWAKEIDPNAEQSGGRRPVHHEVHDD
jgi:hypothetical protein